MRMRNKIFTHFMLGLCLLGASMNAAAQERLSFGVISDIHFDNGVGEGAMVKVPKALKNLTSYGSLDALAIAGDLADAGRADQYEQLVSVFNDKSNFTNPVGDLLFLMGNHDHAAGNGVQNYQQGLSVFNGGEPYPLDQYKVIKGYPFITISMRTTGSNAYPADLRKQLDDWMQQAAQECPGKPIFVFTHVPPQWTVYGSWPEYENGSTWGMTDLNQVLNKYPQAVVFAGHSHYPLGDPRSIHQGTNPDSPRKNYYTAINTASTTYGEIHPGAVNAGIHPEGYAYSTEGMILTELENGDIEIRRFDTYRNTEIHPEERWVLKAPFDGSQFQYADIRDRDDNPDNRPLRDGLPAPAFPKSAQVSVEAAATEATITFPQATDNDCVFRYRVRVFKDGFGIFERFVFSQFYLYSGMPEKLSLPVVGLSSSTAYTVEVVAYDSYDNISDPITASFKTAEGGEGEMIKPSAHWNFDNPDDLLSPQEGEFVMSPVMAGNDAVSAAESLDAAGITVANGPTETDGAIFLPKGSGMRIGRPAGASTTQNWTIMWYMMLPNASPYNCLFQTNGTNVNDGDLFILNNKIGMGAMGGYFGEIKNETWHRIVFANRDGDCYIYVDGQQTINFPGGASWEIDPWGFYIYIDDDGEMSDTYLAEFSYWDFALSDNQVKALSNIAPSEETFVNILTSNVKVADDLNFTVTINANVPFTFQLPDWIEGVDIAPFMGKRDYKFRAQPMDYSGRRSDPIIVKAEGLDDQEITVEQIFVDEGEAPEALGWWTFDNPADLMQNQGSASKLSAAFKGASGPEMTNDLEAHGIRAIPGPTEGNGAITVPANSYLWLQANSGNEEHRTYTILYDVMLNDLSGYKSMLQTNMSNTSDAVFFFKDNMLGRGGNLGYNGDFQTETWYRILYVVKDGCPTLYVNGEKLSEYTRTVDYAIMGPEALLFADEDGEEGLVNVASIRFWDIALSEKMAARLGDPYSDVEELLLVQTPSVRLIDETDFAINVNSNVPFTFTLPDWIEALDTEWTEGEKNYLFRAQPLTEEGTRTGVITVEAEYMDPIGVSVTQIKLGEGMPEPYAVWTFDDPSNLLAGTGAATLQAAFKGENGPEVTTDLEGNGFSAIDGPKEGNGAIGVNEDTYLWLTNNTGYDELRDYTLMFDLRPRMLGVSNALYQKNVLNNTDAGLFISKGMVGRNEGGLGYHGEMVYMKWHRIVFVVKAGVATVYIDGDKVGQATSASPVWTMMPEVLLFADDNGEECYNELCELRFWDVPLSEAHARELGAVDQEWDEEPFLAPNGHWTFDDPNDLMAGTGTATLKGSYHKDGGTPQVVEDLASVGIVPIEGPSAGNGAITVPFGSSLQMAHNEESGTLNSFTVLMDVRFKFLNGYNVLYQADMTNGSDASLFTLNGQIGIRKGGLGYAGSLEENKWHRIVFKVENNLMHIYIDGVKINQAANPEPGTWVMRELCYFFADNDGEEKDIDVAEICFWNDIIPAAQIKYLGTAGMPTGIETVRAAEPKAGSQGIYNLKGQRLSQPQRGLNIIDGKLILIK